jgi:signal transduction histidine kinase
VRQLAEALGRTVAIESAPAAGSKSTVVLPLGPAAEPLGRAAEKVSAP